MLRDEFPPDAFPLVVAHRGASRHHRENTLEAFRAAIDAGSHVVELDVRLTADAVPVVMHDADVSRVTGGAGLVHELTLEELRRSGPSGGKGLPSPVPTLREALELVSGRAAVDLEIKNLPGEPGFDPAREAILEAALEELRASFAGPALVSSFNRRSLERSRELAPNVPTGLLTTAAVSPAAALARALEGGHGFVLPEVSALLGAGEAFVREAHGAGVRVGTWTVDDPRLVRRLFGWSVDAVATNDPEMALAVRASRRPPATPRGSPGGR